MHPLPSTHPTLPRESQVILLPKDKPLSPSRGPGEHAPSVTTWRGIDRTGHAARPPGQGRPPTPKIRDGVGVGRCPTPPPSLPPTPRPKAGAPWLGVPLSGGACLLRPARPEVGSWKAASRPRPSPGFSPFLYFEPGAHPFAGRAPYPQTSRSPAHVPAHGPTHCHGPAHTPGPPPLPLQNPAAGGQGGADRRSCAGRLSPAPQSLQAPGLGLDPRFSAVQGSADAQ